MRVPLALTVALVLALAAAFGAGPLLAAEARGSSPSQGPVVDVPEDIADDCSRDVTDQVNAWIESVSDGSTLRFAPEGCYRVDGSVAIVGRSGLVIDGRRSTFRAETKGASDRRHFYLADGRDLTIRNLTVRGANPSAGASSSAYVHEYEFQHAFEIRSTRGATLDRVRAFDVHGDFVYIGGTNGESRNVRVRRSVFEGSGRQGIAVTNGERILVERNRIGGVPQAIFDLEPNFDGGLARDIRIVRNVTGDGYFWFASEGRGNHIGAVSVRDNVMKQATTKLVRVLGEAVGTPRGPFLFEGNELEIDPTGATVGVAAAFLFANCRDVTIRGNVAQFPQGTNMAVVRADRTKPVVVRGNTFQGATTIIERS